MSPLKGIWAHCGLFDEDEESETTVTTQEPDQTTSDPNGVERITSGTALLVSIVMCFFKF